SAEFARIKGHNLDAIRWYERAIECARRSGRVQNEAIANEVAAKFYLENGFTTAGDAHLRNAHACYLRWGARGKVKQFESLYSEFQQRVSSRFAHEAEYSLEQLDLKTVMTALQALHREIDLGKLIEALMAVSVQNAGAERALLFLSRGTDQLVEAEAITGQDGIRVTLRHAIVKSPKFARSIFRYVVRTRESVLVNDASVQNEFQDDEYVRENRLRSVLCLPLVKMGELVGVLYLENNLTSHVFTPKQCALLEVLSSQAAISLDNARLVGDLQKENRDRQSAEEALRASEERWRKLFENASAGIALFTADGLFVAANLAVQKMLGYSENELRQSTLLELTDHRDRAENAARLAEYVNGQPNEQRFEQRYVRKDGETVWVDFSAVFVPAAGNTPGVISAVIVNITERKQAEEELKRIRLRESEMVQASRREMMGRLTASLAHELNQPLAAIRSNAETADLLLTAQKPDLALAKAAIEDVIRDNNRAVQTIRNVRALFQRDRLETSPVDLREVLFDAERIVRSDAKLNKISLKLNLPKSLPRVIGNRSQLMEVMLNLLINAFDSVCESADGVREVEVFASEPMTGFLRIAVRDSGKGIDPEIMTRIFDAFFTSKPGGMGMGLSIVRSIVENHRGRIWATPNAERGVTLEFEIPITTSPHQGTSSEVPGKG
ncbi:MAG: PAS domain S-box protein, partial [Verrucomicrobia bacterium]|nr:PAS domain S-box protein [Verrucomicrobiota bacterium]